MHRGGFEREHRVPLQQWMIVLRCMLDETCPVRCETPIATKARKLPNDSAQTPKTSLNPSWRRAVEPSCGPRRWRARPSGYSFVHLPIMMYGVLPGKSPLVYPMP